MENLAAMVIVIIGATDRSRHFLVMCDFLKYHYEHHHKRFSTVMICNLGLRIRYYTESLVKRNNSLQKSFQ